MKDPLVEDRLLIRSSCAIITRKVPQTSLKTTENQRGHYGSIKKHAPHPTYTHLSQPHPQPPPIA